MLLWIFSSENCENIELGFKNKKWAVSVLDQSTSRQRFTKSRKMTENSFGLLYCSKDHVFTVPFKICSLPLNETVENIWPQKWELPFNIQPLGSPDRRLALSAAKYDWDCLSPDSNPACDLNGMNGRTIFIPNEISEKDWGKIIRDLGFREAN